MYYLRLPCWICSESRARRVRTKDDKSADRKGASNFDCDVAPFQCGPGWCQVGFVVWRRLPPPTQQSQERWILIFLSCPRINMGRALSIHEQNCVLNHSNAGRKLCPEQEDQSSITEKSKYWLVWLLWHNFRHRFSIDLLPHCAQKKHLATTGNPYRLFL